MKMREITLVEDRDSFFGYYPDNEIDQEASIEAYESGLAEKIKEAYPLTVVNFSWNGNLSRSNIDDLLEDVEPYDEWLVYENLEYIESCFYEQGSFWVLSE